MRLETITPVVLTFNEAPNVRRVLQALSWAHRVVILDSGSDDGTLEIAAGFPNVSVFSRTFDTHAAQWQHALASTGIETEWVLAMDADYLATPGLVEEIRTLDPPEDVSGYETSFTYCIHGRPLPG